MTAASPAGLQSHYKVRVRGSEVCSGLQEASQIPGTTQLAGEGNRKIEGKCQERASGHPLLMPSFLSASSRYCLTSHGAHCAHQLYTYACAWPPASLLVHWSSPRYQSTWPHCC